MIYSVETPGTVKLNKRYNSRANESGNVGVIDFCGDEDFIDAVSRVLVVVTPDATAIGIGMLKTLITLTGLVLTDITARRQVDRGTSAFSGVERKR